ncbi:hypothetical protein ACFQX6_16745 [Streptosporangium lutulentum]
MTVTLDQRMPDGPWKAELTLTSGMVKRTVTATLTFPRSGMGLAVSPDSNLLTLLGVIGGLVVLVATFVLAIGLRGVAPVPFRADSRLAPPLAEAVSPRPRISTTGNLPAPRPASGRAQTDVGPTCGKRDRPVSQQLFITDEQGFIEITGDWSHIFSMADQSPHVGGLREETGRELAATMVTASPSENVRRAGEGRMPESRRPDIRLIRCNRQAGTFEPSV